MSGERVLHCHPLLVGDVILLLLFCYIDHIFHICYTLYVLEPHSIGTLYFFLMKQLPFVHAAEKDWDDIKFGVDNGVDFYAVSFVKDAAVVHELKNYLKSKCFC